MRLEELLEKLECLDIGSSLEAYTLNDGTKFMVKRPTKAGKNLKRKYDAKKNLQIWVEEPGKAEFMPNHLRLLIDLEFARRARPDLKSDLLLAFDDVFYGGDVVDIAYRIEGIELPTILRPIGYDLFLEQLFLGEQTIGYHFDSKFDPKCLYLHGWVRCILCGEEEVDKVVWSATRSPPKVKYTYKDNRKHRKYEERPKSLWYLDEGCENGTS